MNNDPPAPKHNWLFVGWLAVVVAVLAACGVPGASSATRSVPPAGGALHIGLKAPPGFRISVYARDLGEARMLAFDDQGIPYVTIRLGREEPNDKVVAIPDRDKDGQADEVVLVLEGLDRAHGLTWQDGSMYVSDVRRILRIVDTDKDLVAERTEVVVDGMSDVGDHWARPFIFAPDESILVAIGSTCNVCQEGDKSRATIQRYSESGEHLGSYAAGLRSIVGLTMRPSSTEVWATNHGRDELGPDLPPDTLLKVEQGKHYGWPYCYGDRVVDQEVLDDPDIVPPDRSPKDQFCQTQVTPPTVLLPAHAAPQGLAFYDGAQFPDEMHGGLFIAWHGAWDFSTKIGFRVVFAPFIDGKIQPTQDFVTGWLKPDGSTWNERPNNVAVGPDGSLYIIDDVNGNVYRVDYVG